MILLFFSFLNVFKIASALVTEAPQETAEQVPTVFEAPAIETYEANKPLEPITFSWSESHKESLEGAVSEKKLSNGTNALSFKVETKRKPRSFESGKEPNPSVEVSVGWSWES